MTSMESSRPNPAPTSVAVSDPRCTKRVAYSAIQAIAPVYAGEKIEDDSFHEVVCRDISIGGLSFWTATYPKTKHLVVRLVGGASLTHMLMEVRHVTEKETDHGPQFLVGCMFLKRLTPGDQFASRRSP